MSERPLALVTGAAVRLGKVIALELARAGYAIAVHYHHSVDAAQQTATEIRELGVPAYPIQADLTRPQDISVLFEMIKSLPHLLTVLVNSAAVMPHGNLQTMGVEEWDAVMNLNLRAAWLCLQQAAPLMGPRGVVVNISDTGASKTWTAFPAYNVSKAALETLTRLQAKTYAPNIRVNAVAPGLILPADGMPEEDWKRLVDRTLLKSSGMPDAISKTVLFIIQNPHITGATLIVDGGYQLAGS